MVSVRTFVSVIFLVTAVQGDRVLLGFMGQDLINSPYRNPELGATCPLELAIEDINS